MVGRAERKPRGRGRGRGERPAGAQQVVIQLPMGSRVAEVARREGVLRPRQPRSMMSGSRRSAAFLPSGRREGVRRPAARGFHRPRLDSTWNLLYGIQKRKASRTRRPGTGSGEWSVAGRLVASSIGSQRRPRYSIEG